MKSRLIATLFGLAAVSAHADIYKNVDDSGHVTYSNIQSKGAKKLDLEPLTTMPKPHADPDLKVDSGTQKLRDDTRHKILTEELSAEEARLAESKQSLKDAKGDALKTQKSQEDVALHEKNIDALKHEITNMKVWP